MAKLFTGKVISTKMSKTIVVLVERKLRHPVYKKVINRRKKYKAHYEGSDISEGDVVQIKEVRPMSRDKRFMVVGDLGEKKLKVSKEKEESKS